MEGLDENNLCVEKKKLAVTLYSKSDDIKTLYFRMRDILATITDDLKHKAVEFTPAEALHSYEHPVNLNEVVIDGEIIGRIGIVHPVISKKIDKKGNIVFAEIDVEKFANAADAGITYSEPSKFPPMTYDLSLELKPDMMFSVLKGCWDTPKLNILRGVKIVDTYDTDTIHSITVRFEFSSNERTLSSNEVQEIMDKIIQNLSDKGVNLR